MLEDMSRPVPEETLNWAEGCVMRYRDQSLEDRAKTPMIAVIVAFGIYYGIRKTLERAFIAFPESFNPENIEMVTRQIVMSECMRRYNLDTMLMRITHKAIMGKRYYMGKHVLMVSFMVLPYASPSDAETMHVHFIEEDKTSVSTTTSSSVPSPPGSPCSMSSLEHDATFDELANC
jgi:hypothetical protein